jgi:uncharacterized membrane protein
LSTLLAVAAAAFFLLHMLPSTPIRARLVAIAGERAYLGAYAILSLLLLWWLVARYNAAPYGEKLWIAPSWWTWVKAVLILFAFILIICGATSPNPSSPGAGKLLSRGDVSGGIFAITRHPIMWGVGIWALSHLVSQATVPGLLFFGSLAATALVGSWLQDHRKRAALEGWSQFEAKTSFFPFAAILEHRSRLDIKALGWWRIAFAVALWAALLHFHLMFFGVRPLAFPT